MYKTTWSNNYLGFFSHSSSSLGHSTILPPPPQGGQYCIPWEPLVSPKRKASHINRFHIFNYTICLTVTTKCSRWASSFWLWSPCSPTSQQICCKTTLSSPPLFSFLSGTWKFWWRLGPKNTVSVFDLFDLVHCLWSLFPRPPNR